MVALRTITRLCVQLLTASLRTHAFISANFARTYLLADMDFSPTWRVTPLVLLRRVDAVQLCVRAGWADDHGDAVAGRFMVALHSAAAAVHRRTVPLAYSPQGVVSRCLSAARAYRRLLC